MTLRRSTRGRGLAVATLLPAVALVCLVFSLPPAQVDAESAIDGGPGVLHWSDPEAGAIGSFVPDGSEPRAITIQVAARGLAVDPTGRTLYAAGVNPPSILRVSIGEPKLEQIVAIERGQPEFLALDADAGIVYWTESGTNLIRNAQIDGVNPRTLVTLDAPPQGIALDTVGKKLYWSTGDPRPAIQRSNLDGSDLETIVPASKLVRPGDIELDLAAGELYWIDRADLGHGAIRRAKLDGSQVQDVLLNLRAPSGLAVDTKSRRVYWSGLEAQDVRRISLIGAGTAEVVAKQVGRTVDIDFVEPQRSLPPIGVADGDPRPLTAAELDAALKRLAEACSKIGTLAVDYREEKHLDLFPEPIISTGRLYYRRSKFVRLDSKTPFVSATILADDEVARFIQEKGRWRRLQVKSQEALTTVMNQMAAWLRGDLAASNRMFELSGRTGAKGAVLSLRPRKGGRRALIDHMEMALAPDARRVDSVSIYETLDEYTILHFLAELRDVELPKGTFDTSGGAPTEIDLAPHKR